MNNTFQILSDLLTEEYKVPATSVHPDATLTSLGFDSLTLMEFVFSAEDAFGLRIPEERLGESLSTITIQNICDAIDQLKKS